MNADELREVLDLHGRWLRGEDGGVRADLRYVDLMRADLRYADLRYADLRYADLRDVDLRDADLRDADLRYADLRYADLMYANLSCALDGANLRHADLRHAIGRPADIGWATHGPVGHHGTVLTLYAPADQPTIVTGGCFLGTLDRFRDVVDAGGDPWWEWPKDKVDQYQTECRTAIALFDRVAGGKA